MEACQLLKVRLGGRLDNCCIMETRQFSAIFCTMSWLFKSKEMIGEASWRLMSTLFHQPEIFTTVMTINEPTATATIHLPYLSSPSLSVYRVSTERGAGVIGPRRLGEASSSAPGREGKRSRLFPTANISQVCPLCQIMHLHTRHGISLTTAVTNEERRSIPRGISVHTSLCLDGGSHDPVLLTIFCCSSHEGGSMMEWSGGSLWSQTASPAPHQPAV